MLNVSKVTDAKLNREKAKNTCMSSPKTGLNGNIRTKTNHSRMCQKFKYLGPKVNIKTSFTKNLRGD
jgi:hypothetical protein